HQAKSGADGNAGTDHGKRSPPLVGGKVVRQQRVGRRNAAGLANSNTETKDKQLPKIGGDTAESRESAPHRNGNSHDALAAGSIGKQRDGNGEGGIKKREGKAP